MLFRSLPKVLATLALTIVSVMAQAQAHDWYPMECCHGKDCAPVDRVDMSTPDGITVTSRHGTARR